MIDSRDYSVIIMSCDSYSDIWDPMIYSFDKFWPECPFPIYLCSETKKFEHPRIRNIQVHERMGWSEMLIAVLKQLTTKNIIYLQEDYILKGNTNNEALLNILEFYENRNAAYLRLIPYPPPRQIIDENLNIGKLEKGSQYRTSLQAAVWDRMVLLDLLDSSENGWQFEKNSVERSGLLDRPFFSVGLNSDEPNKNLHRYPLDYYSTAILQGKWQKEGVKMLRKAGIPINTSKRGCLTRWDFYYYHQQKKRDSFYLQFLKLIDQYIFNPKSNYRKF